MAAPAVMWEQMLKSAINREPDAIPEGFKTIQQWADHFGKGRNQAGVVLRALAEKGEWEMKKFNTVICGKLLNMAYYRPKGA